MGSAARRHIDLAIPRAQHGDRQMRGRAEAEQSNAIARLDSGHSQASEAYDAGAKQRRGGKVVEFRGKLKSEVVARHGILRIAAVDGVSGEDRRIAKIFESAAAVWAISVDTANPGNADARAGRQLGRSALHDITHDLVAGDER